MNKIASPIELQAELRSILAFIQGHGPEGKLDRQVIAAKLQDVADRVASDEQHGLSVGDILYASYGYNRTLVKFYQVIKVAGKSVIVQAVASKVVGRKDGENLVMPVPGSLKGQPYKRLPKGSGKNVLVKIDSVILARFWDGKQLSEDSPEIP